MATPDAALVLPGSWQASHVSVSQRMHELPILEPHPSSFSRIPIVSSNGSVKRWNQRCCAAGCVVLAP